MKNNKFNFLRLFFLTISIIIIFLGIFMPKIEASNALILGLCIIALVVLDKNMAKISKLSEENPKVKTMRFINRLVMSIIIILGVYSLCSPFIKVSETTLNSILTISIAIFIMIFGNLSPKIPFNRYMGLRLPWTIRDEDTWRQAHNILGYLSFPIGIIMIIASFFIKSEVALITCILVWILVPSLYSLWFYYKKFKI